MFEDPFTFDIERTPNEHVAFGGGGPHFCLGANLARMEINVMFDEVLDRLHDIELTAPVSRLRSNFINGLKHIPLKFNAEALVQDSSLRTGWVFRRGLSQCIDVQALDCARLTLLLNSLPALFSEVPIARPTLANSPRSSTRNHLRSNLAPVQIGWPTAGPRSGRVREAPSTLHLRYAGSLKTMHKVLRG